MKIYIILLFFYFLLIVFLWEIIKSEYRYIEIKFINMGLLYSHYIVSFLYFLESFRINV